MGVLTGLETLFEDFRIGACTLRKNPGFAAITVLTLAIGIGANTAIFGLANAAFFRPLPYPNAERLAFLWQNNQRTGETRGLVSYPNYADWRSASHSFADMGFFMSGKSILSGAGDPERTPGALVSTNFFSVLGVNPAIGRSFSPDEQRPGHSNVSVISYHLWRTTLGGDPQVLGRNLNSSGGEKHTIIGVMPPGFSFPDQTEVWTPREVGEFFRTKARQYPNQQVIGRLNPGVTWAEAQTELDTIAGRLASEYPSIDGGSRSSHRAAAPATLAERSPGPARALGRSRRRASDRLSGCCKSHPRPCGGPAKGNFRSIFAGSDARQNPQAILVRKFLTFFYCFHRWHPSGHLDLESSFKTQSRFRETRRFCV